MRVHRGGRGGSQLVAGENSGQVDKKQTGCFGSCKHRPAPTAITLTAAAGLRAVGAAGRGASGGAASGCGSSDVGGIEALPIGLDADDDVAGGGVGGQGGVDGKLGAREWREASILPNARPRQLSSRSREAVHATCAVRFRVAPYRSDAIGAVARDLRRSAGHRRAAG